MKVIFFGTPQFAANVLSHLLAHGVDIQAVVTKPDRPVGRSSTPVPTPVKITALNQSPPLPVFQPTIVSEPHFAPTLEAFQADLFVVVAYGEIIKQHLLDMPKVACINLHASLLPKYRGAAPIQHSIIQGETETGLTVIHMAKKMDAGDMISTVAVPIGPNTTYGELEELLCSKGSQLLLETIKDFERHSTQRTPQDHSQATFASKIELEDCQVHWNRPAHEIHNLIRGVTPHPGAWCFVKVRGEPKRLKILSSRLASPDNKTAEPGTILNTSESGITIACSTGAIILRTIQLEGKKALPAEEFIRGIAAENLTFL